jgi:Na+-transporting methylmalonyl-CoA/oxaloacetate decarboxylase gamma subunit
MLGPQKHVMEHLGWGLQITALGMGLVFGLLALLWGLLTLVLHLDRPPMPAAADGAAAPVPAAPDELADPALVAAITLAVLIHAAQRRKEAAPLVRAHWPGSLLHASRWVASGRLRQNRTFRKGR